MSTSSVKVREGRADSSVLSDQSLLLPGQWDNQHISRGSSLLEPVGTNWVERDVLGISEEVHRVTLGKCKVASCTCGNCERKGHFPHVVLELGKDGRTYPVFGFTSFGPHVLQRLLEIHVSQKPNEKSIKNNREVQKNRKAKARQVQSETMEITQAALESTKYDWRGPRGLRTKAY